MTYRDFIEWLSNEDFNRVGAVNGRLLDEAVAKGHAKIDEDTCFLTESGWGFLNRIAKEENEIADAMIRARDK